jgi:hypothetical protein
MVVAASEDRLHARYRKPASAAGFFMSVFRVIAASIHFPYAVTDTSRHLLAEDGGGRRECVCTNHGSQFLLSSVS